MLASTNRPTEIQRTEVWLKKSGPKDEGRLRRLRGKIAPRQWMEAFCFTALHLMRFILALTPINCIHFRRGTLNISAKDEGLTRTQKQSIRISENYKMTEDHLQSFFSVDTTFMHKGVSSHTQIAPVLSDQHAILVLEHNNSRLISAGIRQEKISVCQESFYYPQHVRVAVPL